MTESENRVTCVGLKTFDSGPCGGLAITSISDGEKGMTLEDVDTHEDFSSLFEGTRPIETHRPEDVLVALSRAIDIARDEQLPLYRVTSYTDKHSSQCEIYESM